MPNSRCSGPKHTACSTIERLELAADAPTGIHFVGASVTTDGQPAFVSWRQLHDEARAVGAALQARGLGPGDHVAILGPTSRGLITAIRGCWMAGIASMVLPLPMRMGSLEAFISSTRARISHGDAKLANFAWPAGGRVAAIDWAGVAAAPLGRVLGYYLAVNRRGDETLAAYRRLLPIELTDPEWQRHVDAAILVGALTLLWQKALAGDAAELDWWVERVEALV